MLEQVLRSLRNWFEVAAHTGKYTVQEGSVELPFLATGQYYRIEGSVFNDGLHQYGGIDELRDETFTGTVYALAIPKAVEELAQEMTEYQQKNPATGLSSESFGGYSYSRAAGANGTPATVWDVYRPRLNEWRKM